MKESDSHFYLRLELLPGVLDGLLPPHLEVLHVLLDDGVEGLLVYHTNHRSKVKAGGKTVLF